ncbi:cytochrome P450 [Phaeosphaeriaceae sp. PMI808]|nr:cytochrome P450 [Phaeosphaeriaceae sp. PMI808]
MEQHRHIIKGDVHLWIQDLHRKFGPIVRCTPNMLSIVTPEVWKDAYGHGTHSFEKEPKFYGPDAYGQPVGIIRSDKKSHARQRKLVSHAFSDKALREQEDLLKGYAKTLVEKLKEISMKDDRPNIDLVRWYNYTTFDIMADLTFGESLGQLTGSAYHAWVGATFATIQFVSFGRIARGWPGLTNFIGLLIPASMKKARSAHIKFAANSVEKRMARETDRPDIWTYVTRNMGTDGDVLTQSELYSNGSTFMVAGTETTATLLSGLTYILLDNPQKLERLNNEIRGAFSSMDDMTIAKLSQLEYLQACIEEGLRLYPPISVGLPRIVPNHGAKICGRWVPGGVEVSCPLYAAARYPAYFHKPEVFAPERFLVDRPEEFASDRKDASNPFSYGSRNCLGKNLAYHEIRLVLASVLLHFDLKLCTESQNWLNQRTFAIWEKKPLLVQLKSVN